MAVVDNDDRTSDSPGPAYEENHVHSVYDQIASHFSSTRYKPWPLVSSFLLAQPPGSVGLDVGCGNGKYLAVNPSLYILGSDRSPALVDIASSLHGTKPQNDVLVADTLSLPHPTRRFDFAVCIAVVHHLSTRPRRVDAIGAILDTLRLPSPSPSLSSRFHATPGPTEGATVGRTDGGAGGGGGGGTALIYVWALEQKGSRRGWDEGGEQDVMVPWVTKEKKKADGGGAGTDGGDGRASAGVKGGGEEGPVERTFHRYYHLYRRGELEEDIEAAGGVVVDAGYERDNWWAVASPSPAPSPSSSSSRSPAVTK